MERFIDIDGEPVPVTEEVYRAYKRPAWSERKRRETRKKKERSLDKFKDSGFDIPDDTLPEEIVEDALLLDLLMAALDELTAEERGLIDALYYEDTTIREYAAISGKSKSAVQRTKDRVIEKLQTFFE